MGCGRQLTSELSQRYAWAARVNTIGNMSTLQIVTNSCFAFAESLRERDSFLKAQSFQWLTIRGVELTINARGAESVV